MDILAALQHHGPIAFHQQPQRREHAGRTGANDDNGLCIMHFPVRRQGIFRRGLPRPVSLHFIAIQHILAGIDRAAHDAHRADPDRLHAQFPGRFRAELLLGQFLSDLLCDFKFFHRASSTISAMSRTGRSA